MYSSPPRPLPHSPTRFGVLAIVLLLVGCHSRPNPVVARKPAAIVVWISIDGFGRDYLARYHPPTLSRLAAEGAFTTAQRPVFPSLTFPNHVSQATGVTVDKHGIVANSFFDDADQQFHRYPNDGGLLRAEPIWIAAQRQGIQTAVIDWPLSQVELGPVVAAVHGDHFDPKETDRQRLDRTLAMIDGKPLRLVMTYLSNVDHIGHLNGPDSPELADAVRAADADVDHFLGGLRKWFDKTHSPADELVVLITTDHGMTGVSTQVSLDRLIGADLMPGVKTVCSGPVGMIHSSAADAAVIVDRLKSLDYLTVYPADQIPPRYHYADPTRLGSVVVLLHPGYTYVESRLATTLPAAGPKGMHGYDPATCPDMLGTAIVWRLRTPLGGRDLGPVDATQWDAAVCRWLDITPPAGVESASTPGFP